MSVKRYTVTVELSQDEERPNRVQHVMKARNRAELQRQLKKVYGRQVQIIDAKASELPPQGTASVPSYVPSQNIKAILSMLGQIRSNRRGRAA